MTNSPTMRACCGWPGGHSSAPVHNEHCHLLLAPRSQPEKLLIMHHFLCAPYKTCTRRSLSLLFFATTISFLSGPGLAGNWPQFRGANSMGVAEHSELPDRWSATENVAWKKEIPGRGWSSPVVWGNQVFLTTVVSEGEMEEPKKGLYLRGERPPPGHTHHWTVLSFDLESGRELWQHKAHSGIPANQVHLKNSYATETPVTDGERLYVYFGNVGMFCYNLEGEPLWSTHWDPVATRHGWGSAASPVLHQDRVFIVNDNEEKSFLAALDTRTGKILWQIDRDEKSNWATPYIWRNELRTELVVPGAKKVRSYDLDGNLLWELGGMSSIVIPTPFSQFGLLYVTSGYVLDAIRPVFAIRPGGSGDISLQSGETSNEFIKWHQRQSGPYNPSPLVYGDYFYVLFDSGFLSCHDARTGREIYDKQRIRTTPPLAFTASPWGANGKIFALSEDGDTFVFQSGPEYKLLHVNSLDEMCMATPALAEDRILIRTLTQLYCIQSHR
jgi:outer membrane protein assembly factor BamB